MKRAVLIALLLIVPLGVGRAVAPEERLADPALEARAHALGQELRCLVCDNETIEGSNAPLASDLRRLVRERMIAGDSDAEIRAMLVERYGEYVLFRPRYSARTLILWLGPFAVLAFVIAALALRSRRVQAPAPTPLTSEDEEEIAALRGKNSPTSGK